MPKAASPSSSDGNYRFTDSINGAQRLAVIGETMDDVQQFFAKFSDRGIESRIPGQPHIYAGTFRYEPKDRFKPLFPLNDGAKAIFDNGVKNLLPPGNLFTSAVTGKLAAPGLPPSSVSGAGDLVKAGLGFAASAEGPFAQGLPAAAQEIKHACAAVKVKLQAALKTGGPEHKPLVAVVFSYMPEEGMTKIGRDRVRLGSLAEPQ